MSDKLKFSQECISDDPYDRIEIKREMSVPSFDELSELAKHNPTQFEALRTELCAQLIHSAPETLKHRLRGIQFSIDMERQRQKSNYSNCLHLSQLMHDSLEELAKALSNPGEYLRNLNSEKCEVVPLFRD